MGMDRSGAILNELALRFAFVHSYHFVLACLVQIELSRRFLMPRG